ncbi:MAG: sugar phosphate nucleotidyltransferase [Bacteroidota bacterium]|nr:sugar phosphate nucleotidyltransferase [Bacteroidota bacterium]
MKPTLIILAAGLGSRYGGLKQMDRFGPSGETILEYSIYDAIRSGFGKVIFVIRESMEEDLRKTILKKIENKIETVCVFQKTDDLPNGFQLPEGREKPWGTAHAILAARNKVKEPFTVINADDFYGLDSYKVMAGYFANNNKNSKECAMVGFELHKTVTEHGTVSRGICSLNPDSFLTDVVERTKISKKGANIYFEENGKQISLTGNELVSMNFWGFQANAMEMLQHDFSVFLRDNIQKPKSEFFIPWAVNEWIKRGDSKAKVLSGKSQWFGVTYQEDKDFVRESLSDLIEAGHYPKDLWAN